jgi:hypothetical protein
MHRTNGDSYGTGTSSHGVSGIHIYRDELAGSYDATQGRHQEMNALQEEICDVIEHESIALNSDSETPSTMTQLRAALDARHVASRITNDSSAPGTYVDDSLTDLDSRLDTLEGQTLDTRISTLEGQTLDTRISTLEGQTLDSRLDTLEGQNLDSRLDAFEADTTYTDSTIEGPLKMYGFSSDVDVPFYALFHRYRVSDTHYLIVVHLYLVETYSTSTSIYLGFTSANIPALLRPDTAQSSPIMIFDDSSILPFIGCLRITDTGDWEIHNYANANLTSSNNKGVGAQLIQYRKTVVSS